VSAYVFGGWFTTKEAVTNIRQKRFEIDSLMLLAAVGAASIGAWAEGLCCCSCSVWGIPLKATRWGGQESD
jgi:cation transport ATPase